jgi:hypothetical protein
LLRLIAAMLNTSLFGGLNPGAVGAAPGVLSNPQVKITNRIAQVAVEQRRYGNHVASRAA